MLGKKCSLAPLKEELRKQGVSSSESTSKSLIDKQDTPTHITAYHSTQPYMIKCCIPGVGIATEATIRYYHDTWATIRYSEFIVQ